MARFAAVLILLALGGELAAAVLPVTPYTVVARVQSFEHYRAYGDASRFGLATPYGNDDTIVATIVLPESLAGREIAIPFESKRSGQEVLVQRGTIFRFEYHANLADLRSRTDGVYRRAIPFPLMGIIALKPDGEVAEAYEGMWSSRLAADQRKQAAGSR
jgi:hypothetical protein